MIALLASQCVPLVVAGAKHPEKARFFWIEYDANHVAALGRMNVSPGQVLGADQFLARASEVAVVALHWSDLERWQSVRAWGARALDLLLSSVPCPVVVVSRDSWSTATDLHDELRRRPEFEAKRVSFLFRTALSSPDSVLGTLIDTADGRASAGSLEEAEWILGLLHRRWDFPARDLPPLTRRLLLEFLRAEIATELGSPEGIDYAETYGTPADLLVALRRFAGVR